MLFQCIYTLFYAMLSNAYFLLDRLPWWAWLCWTALLIAANVLPLAAVRKLSARHLRVCRHGVICLRTFFWSLPADIAVHIFLLCRFGWKTMGLSLLVCSIAEAISGTECCASTVPPFNSEFGTAWLVCFAALCPF